MHPVLKTILTPFLACILTLPVLTANAQTGSETYDLRLGVGSGYYSDEISYRSKSMAVYEGEINCKINPFLASSLALAYSHGNLGFTEPYHIVHGSLNLFVSPFRNDRRNDFRLGGGFTYLYRSETRVAGDICPVGSRYEDPGYIPEVETHGYSIIMENTFSITDRWKVGAKLALYTFEKSMYGYYRLKGDRLILKLGYAL